MSLAYETNSPTTISHSKEESVQNQAKSDDLTPTDRKETIEKRTPYINTYV